MMKKNLNKRINSKGLWLRQSIVQKNSSCTINQTSMITHSLDQKNKFFYNKNFSFFIIAKYCYTILIQIYNSFFFLFTRAHKRVISLFGSDYIDFTLSIRSSGRVFCLPTSVYIDNFTGGAIC